jgi:replication-associated recombination protein RarA
MNMKTIEKYAPRDLREVVFASESSRALIEAVAQGEIDGNVILHGPNGTGKSTAANLLAHALGGADSMVETKDFSTVLTMPDIKDYLQRCVNVAKFTTSKKYFLIWHEFDNAKANPHALWTALDDLGTDVMLILTTNNFIKIHPSVRSRCYAVDMPALKATDVLPRAQWILAQEGLSLARDQLLSYLQPQQVSGDLRKYFGELDKLLYLHRQGLPMPQWNPVITRQAMRVV